MTNRATRMLAIFGVAVSTVGCGVAGLGEGPIDELERNEERWARFGPSSYVYGIERQCFCGEPARGPVRVTVQDGVVVSRTYVSTSDPVPADLEDLFPPVPGLFDVLRDAFERDAFSVEVTYDPQLGVPIDFFIDYAENVADEELGFEVIEGVAALVP